MAVLQLPEQARKQLIDLLADDRPNGERLVRRLRQMRSLDGLPAHAYALQLLAHVSLTEEEAEALVAELLEHRGALRRALGRDPGLRVAAIDFLSNIRGVLTNPTIVEQAQLERTERSALTDPVTELFNRRYFDGALELEIRRGRRYAMPLTLLLLDLDGFKSVNDLYGHQVGDLVLSRVGDVLRRSVRESDLCCRFGGEEFAVLFPETERLGAYAVAERVRQRLEEAFAREPTAGRMVTLTMSGGIAAYPQDAETSQELLACADRALYQAKGRGRNRITIFHAERRRAIRFPVRADLSADLSDAGHPTPRGVQAVNLSTSGILLETGDGEPPAGRVELKLGLSPQESWSVSGRVVRVEPADPQRGTRRVAVTFDRSLPEEHVRRHAARGRAGRAAAGGSA
ncbi:MAG TPA: diguanylate cyclase [Candidatus Polarisedimenticolaceae bacterium]|nr:diguanylate cyclase [Candidatus Polarisedimenticolaceae bacterium]